MRHLSWICAACCSLGSTAAIACGPADTLLEAREYTLAPDRPLLLRIDQNGTDLVVALDNAAGTTLFDHPGNRNGFELLYLQAADGATQTVCVHSAYRNPDIRVPHVVSELVADAATLPALRRFSEASRLWATVDLDARRQALADYMALGALEGFPFRDAAGLIAIRAQFLVGLPEDALRAIDAFVPHSQVPDALPHLLSWFRGVAYIRLREFEAAVAPLEQALALSTRPFDTVEIRTQLAEALIASNRVDEGEAQLAIALEEAGADHSLLARIHNNMGYVLLRRAFAPSIAAEEADRWLRASIDEHLVARAFAVNSGDSTEQQMVDNNLGTLYERTRELRKAHYHYREALRLSEAVGDPVQMFVLYSNLGGLNQRLGDYPKSRGYLEQTLRLAEQVGGNLPMRVSCMLGTTYRLLGELEQALAFHETCRDLAAGAADYALLIDALAELSEDNLVAARLPDASGEHRAAAWSTIDAARALVREHLAPVLAIGPIAADPGAVNLCTATRAGGAEDSATLNESDLYRAASVLSRHAQLAGTFAAAETALEDLNLAAGIVGNARYTAQLEVLDAAMRAYRAQGRLDFARACGERALVLSERLHEDLEAERNGPAWSAKTHQTYVALADMLLEQSSAPGDDFARSAFAVAERAMGITLRQHLSLPQGDSQQDEEQRLRTLLNTIADEHAALSAEQKAQLLPVSYYHQHDLVELSRLRAQESVPIPPALDATAVQRQLGEGQTALYYYIGANDAWLFTLDAQRFDAHRLGSAAQLAALLTAVAQDLRSPNGAPAAGLDNLSDFLLPASLQLAGARELLIVPDRDLYKIPFAALTHGISGQERTLIEDFAIRTTPSLTAFFMDKPAAGGARSTDIAVFADPLFNTADLRSAAAGVAEDADLQTWSASLERLPYTELEANSLKALFQPERTLDFLGNRATLANLASAPVRNARILHIATHGYFHSTGSDNVGLVLSAINERNERVPGFVTLTELFGHRFNNELVVISGCDTAMGMQLAGEGMMGLTRGFLAQGARHVISTLWPVSDRASAQFMALFYQHLHSAGSVAEALRAAQQDLKALPDFRHPYYWAPYVLTSVSPADAMKFDANAGAGLVSR